jgi:hypothetical protein
MLDHLGKKSGSSSTAGQCCQCPLQAYAGSHSAAGVNAAAAAAAGSHLALRQQFKGGAGSLATWHVAAANVGR